MKLRNFRYIKLLVFSNDFSILGFDYTSSTHKQLISQYMANSRDADNTEESTPDV
jgi:hypothetical protein